MLSEKYNYNGKCWWSGLIADTKEHRFKASILKMLFSNPDSDPVLVRERKIFDLKSPKNQKAKFRKKNLNSRYNNELSKDFDESFSEFAKYIYRNISTIIYSNQLSLLNIWGDNYLEKHLNVLRFIAKHIGCRMYDLDFKVPDCLVNFLNGSAYCEGLVVIYYIDMSLLEVTENGKYPYFGIEPLNVLQLAEDKNKITDLTGGIELGPFIIRYVLSSEINDEKYPGVREALTYPMSRVELIQRIDETKGNYRSTSNYLHYIHNILPNFIWYKRSK